MLVVLPALVVGVYVYTQLDDQIRERVQQIVANHYPQHLVRVRSARLVRGRGIEVRGLSIAPLDGDGPDHPLIDIEELLIVCDPTLPELVQDQIKPEKIVVRRPRVRATRGADGQWDVARLLPPPKLGDTSPETHIEQATVELIDPSKSPPATLVLRDIDMLLELQHQAPSSPGISSPGTSDRNVVTFQGTLSSEHVQHIALQGMLDWASGRWRVTGTADNVQVCPELLASLPGGLADCRQELNHFRAQAQVRFDVLADPAAEVPLQFGVAGQVARGRLDDPRLPYPLADIQAEIRCTQDLLAIDQLTARHGQTLVQLSGQRQGTTSDAPWSINATARKVLLEPDMVARLPEAQRALWQKYLPEGEVDVDLHLEYDGQTLEPDLVVRCVNVAFTYHKFPYRLEKASGTLTYHGRSLAIDMTAHTGDQPVRIQGELLDPGPTATGYVELRGSEIPIDQRLIQALPGKGRDVVRSLEPAGTLQFYWRGWRDSPDQVKIHSHLALSFNGGSIRYQRFAYPLVNIRGAAEMTDGHWTFRDLEATNDTGFVTCKGELVPTPEGSELYLQLAGAEVPLEEELRSALPPSAARFWESLRPQGRIDLTAQVHHSSATGKTDVALRVEPVADSVAIEPAAFPYRLEKLHGALMYHDGRVDLENISARHGTASLLTQGRCELRPDRSWFLQLERMSIDRLHVDRELLLAMPAKLRQAVAPLNISGPLNVNGSFGLSKGAQETDPLQSRWDVALNVHQGSIDCGVKLSDAYGEVRLTGGHDGQHFQSRGELALDSVIYEGVQLTDVAGPMWIEDQRLLLGVWAEKQQGRESRRITARLDGGTLVGDGWVVGGAEPRFALQASLAGASLERFATETLPGAHKLRGQVHANLALQGNVRGAHNLQGTGTIRLREADIYELPVIVQLLKVLSVRAPNATAFTQSDMNFRIEGEHIYFDRLDLRGDAVSLYGKGEMDFNKQVQLTFHSIVGPNELPVPLLQKVVGEASNQIMQIHVRGTLEEPKITNEAFPGVNQALQQLQADLQGKPQEPSTWNVRNWFRTGSQQTQTPQQLQPTQTQPPQTQPAPKY